MKFIRLIMFGIFLLASTPSFAYNYLDINPTTGAPIGWEPGTTIHYYLDPGTLGGLTNDQLHTLLKEAMKLWENASPNANVPHFEFAGYLPVDVNGTNYQDYVSLGTCFSNDLDSCPTQTQKDLKTVIIFDEDGSILNNELCRITPCSASAGARVFSGSSSNPGFIIQGIAVFGPGLIRPINSNGMGTIVHELGHLLGLAHSYLNQQVGDSQYYPTMMTASISGWSTLNPDDIAGIDALYPTTSSNTAKIKGEILKSDGSPMMHVNVIARNINDPLCEAYSFLSGRVCPEGMHATTLNSSFCVDNLTDEVPFIGNFEISGLPQATYTLEVEEVADPDLAHTLAPGLFDEFIFGDSEFWNEGDQASETNTAFTTITLAAGETRENIDIVLNRSTVTDDRIKYLPLSTFTPGPATRCPSAPPVDYAAMIGIDEGTGGSGGGSSSGGCSLIETE